MGSNDVFTCHLHDPPMEHSMNWDCAAHPEKVYTEAELHQKIVEAGFRNDRLENMLHEAHVLLLTGQAWLGVDGVDTWLTEYEEIYVGVDESPDSAQKTAGL